MPLARGRKAGHELGAQPIAGQQAHPAVREAPSVAQPLHDQVDGTVGGHRAQEVDVGGAERPVRAALRGSQRGAAERDASEAVEALAKAVLRHRLHGEDLLESLAPCHPGEPS